jgi:hypothetical protein
LLGTTSIELGQTLHLTYLRAPKDQSLCAPSVSFVTLWLGTSIYSQLPLSHKEHGGGTENRLLQ